MEPGNSTFWQKKNIPEQIGLYGSLTLVREKISGLGVPLFLFHITFETIKAKISEQKLKSTLPWRFKNLLTGLAAYPWPIRTVEMISVQRRGAAG